jgi:putative endonuclease
LLSAIPGVNVNIFNAATILHEYTCLNLRKAKRLPPKCARAGHNSSNQPMVYHVYILSNPSGVLYVGVINFLERRIMEHRTGSISGFTKKYGVQRLVYFEAVGDFRTAIAREKQLKCWRREKKVGLIRRQNPKFADLSGGLQLGLSGLWAKPR